MKKINTKKYFLGLALLLSTFSLASCGPKVGEPPKPEPTELKKVLETKVVTYDGPELLKTSSLCDIKVNNENLFVYEVNVNTKREFAWENSFKRNAVSYFDFEGRVTIKIDVKESVTSAKVSPLAYGIEPKISGSIIEFTIDQPNNYVIEYNNDSSKAIHLFANPLETNIPSENDPNVIFIKPGLYDAGAIPIESGKTLYISGGAYIYGNIRTELVNDFTIRGRGIISGEIYTRANESDVTCPLEIRKGKNITIEGISLLDPAGWATTIYDCDGVAFDNVKIISSRPNGDGISVQGSKNVTVKDGFVRTWDDSLVVKDNDMLNTENIVFDGVNVWTDLAQSMEVGFETHGEYIKNVTFKNITVVHNYHKACMSIHNADEADISNINYENITLEHGEMLGDNRTDKENDFFIDLSIEYSPEWSESTDLGSVDNVNFSNIKVLDIAESCVSRIRGYEGNHAKVDNVTFSNIDYAGKVVENESDLKLVKGNDVGAVKVKAGEASGRGKDLTYDLNNLDSSKTTIDKVKATKQDAVLVPEFSKLKGDLSYLGDAIDASIKDIKVTHGKGTTFTSPVDDGSGDFNTTNNPASNLFDKNTNNTFESKEYKGEENEFIGVTVEFNDPIYAGNVRLLADKNNAYAFKYGIELRYLKKNSKGEYVNYTIASAKQEYSVSPNKGNALDIAFSANDIKGIQLRFFKSQDNHFLINKVKFSEIQIFGPSLSYKKPVVDATEFNDVYDETRVTDGNPNGTSYYESKGFPAHLVIDLKDVYKVKAISLHLPSMLTWDKRNQEIELFGSNSNSTYDASTTKFTSFFAKQKVEFDPTKGNMKLINLENEVKLRFLKIVIYSNDIPGGYSAQLSEVYVFGTK